MVDSRVRALFSWLAAMKVRVREGAWQCQGRNVVVGGRDVCRKSPALPSHPNDTNSIDLFNAVAKEMGERELRGSWLRFREVHCRREGGNIERLLYELLECNVPALL